MGFFKNLKKGIQDKIDMQDQSVSIERLPTESKGLRSLLGGTTRRKREKNPNLEAFYNSPMYKKFQDEGGIGTMDMYSASDGSIFSSGTVGRMYEAFLDSLSESKPAPTGIEALIRPPRTDPGNQEDMRKLMGMQRQTFRSFLAPPAPPPPKAFPVTGADLGLPTGPGTPAPPGVVFEPEIGNIDIQEILDNLPTGVTMGSGIASVPVPDIPYQIPQITDFPVATFPVTSMTPLAPQFAVVPDIQPVTMPAMRMARVTPDMDFMSQR